MANTYCQLFVHFVFAVQSRESVIDVSWRDDLHRFVAGAVKTAGQRPLAVGGWRDHLHLFVGMKPTVAPSSLMADVKRASSVWVNQKKLCPGHFGWQEGFGAFSYAQSQTPAVVKYILGQEEHHRKMTFREEYEAFLKKFRVPYEGRYLFHEV